MPDGSHPAIFADISKRPDRTQPVGLRHKLVAGLLLAVGLVFCGVIALISIAVALVATVLLQRSEGGALGIGGGGGGFMTGRGKASALTRTTAWLAAGFFVTSIALAIMAGTNRIAPSIIQRAAPPAESSAPPPGGLMDNLKQQQQQQAPTAPAVPQAPISGAPQPPAAPAP